MFQRNSKWESTLSGRRCDKKCLSCVKTRIICYSRSSSRIFFNTMFFFIFYISFSPAPDFSLSLEWRQHYPQPYTCFLGCIALSISFLPASTATVFPASKAALPTCLAASLAVWLVNVRIRNCKIVSNIPDPPITYYFLYRLLPTTSIFNVVYIYNIKFL